MLGANGDLLSTIGICIAAAALLALVGWRLRQPLILAYLLTGVVIGPVVLNFVGDPASITTVAEIGLILLLFIIGLEIDLKKLASAGAPVLLTGGLQVPICIVLGLGFFYALGFRSHKGDYALLYLAATMSLSSTLVVVASCSTTSSRSTPSPAGSRSASSSSRTSGRWRCWPSSPTWRARPCFPSR